VRLTILYPSANIINFAIPFHNENITSLNYEKPSSLVIELQRLSMGASILINTTTMKEKEVALAKAGFPANNNSYVVSATSDQGTSTISDSSPPTTRIEDAGIIHSIQSASINIGNSSCHYLLSRRNTLQKDKEL
jgi:hypothetical protein